MKNAIMLTLILASTRAAWADRDAALAKLEAGEPTLADTRRAALQHAGLADRSESGWSRRARMSGLLPVLTFEVDRRSQDDRGLTRSSLGTERIDIARDHDVSIGAKAVWNLERLLFSDLELRAVKAASQRHDERSQLLARVTTLYFQRRKLQIAALWSPVRDPARAALQELAIDELTAQLDGLTGGYFSRATSQLQ